MIASYVKCTIGQLLFAGCAVEPQEDRLSSDFKVRKYRSYVVRVKPISLKVLASKTTINATT